MEQTMVAQADTITGEMVDAYRRQGFIRIPNLLSPEEVERYREAALALGVTRWQLVHRVLLPAARNGLLAAVLLGVGRAVGEIVGRPFAEFVVPEHRAMAQDRYERRMRGEISDAALTKAMREIKEKLAAGLDAATLARELIE